MKTLNSTAVRREIAEMQPDVKPVTKRNLKEIIIGISILVGMMGIAYALDAAGLIPNF